MWLLSLIYWFSLASFPQYQRIGPVFIPTPHPKMNLVVTICPIGVIAITMAIGPPVAISSPIRPSVPDIKQHPLGHGERLPAAAVLGQEHGEGPVEKLGPDLPRVAWGAPRVGARARESPEHGGAGSRHDRPAEALMRAPPVVDVDLLGPVEADLGRLGELGWVAAGGGEVGKEACALGEAGGVAAVV